MGPICLHLMFVVLFRMRSRNNEDGPIELCKCIGTINNQFFNKNILIWGDFKGAFNQKKCRPSITQIGTQIGCVYANEAEELTACTWLLMFTWLLMYRSIWTIGFHPLAHMFNIMCNFLRYGCY